MVDLETLSDRFAVMMINSQIELDRVSAGVQRRAVSWLHKLEEDLSAKIHRWDVDGVAREAFRRQRAERLIKDVRGLIKGNYNEIRKATDKEFVNVAKWTAKETEAVLNSAVKVPLFNVQFTAAELTALAKKDVVLGMPAKDWWGQQSTKMQNQFAQQMRMGVLSGESNYDLMKRVRGGPTGRRITVELADGSTKRVREYAGGIMDASRRDAKSLVRTSVQSVSNNTQKQCYEQNQDVLQGIEALTTLDGRTTPMCMARTGGMWDFDGNPLPDSAVDESFPGYPPWHFQCRTIMSPITKTFDQLAEELKGSKLKTLKEMPPTTRAAMGAGGVGKPVSVAKIRTFDDYLKKMGDPFARKKLGPGRFDLWKAGKITTRQLINQSGRPRTLAQLRELSVPKVAKAVPKPAPVKKVPKPAPPTAPRKRLTAAEKIRKLETKAINSRGEFTSGTNLNMFGESTNAVELHKFRSGTKLVWKPIAKKGTVRDGISSRGQSKREVIASRVAAKVGMDDLVPKTFWLDDAAGEKLGTYQFFRKGDVLGATKVKVNAVINADRAASFDFILGNTDRRWANVLISEKGELSLIDNGMLLSRKVSDKRVCVFNKDRSGSVIPEEVKAIWRGKKDVIRKILVDEGLHKSAIYIFERRYDLFMSLKNWQ